MTTTVTSPSTRKSQYRLLPLSHIIVMDEFGAELMNEFAGTVLSYVVLGTYDQLGVTLDNLVSHGHLLRVPGEPWSFVATESGRLVAEASSRRLGRHRYAEDDDQ